MDSPSFLVLRRPDGTSAFTAAPIPAFGPPPKSDLSREGRERRPADDRSRFIEAGIFRNPDRGPPCHDRDAQEPRCGRFSSGRRSCASSMRRSSGVVVAGATVHSSPARPRSTDRPTCQAMVIGTAVLATLPGEFLNPAPKAGGGHSNPSGDFPDAAVPFPDGSI